MDSNRKHNAKKIEKWLRCFLEMEWRKRHADEPPFTCLERRAPDGPAADLLLAIPRVPQQQMYSGDSGIYTLKYAQEFLARAVCGGAELKVNRRESGVFPRLRPRGTGSTATILSGMRLRLDLVRDLKREEDTATSARGAVSAGSANATPGRRCPASQWKSSRKRQVFRRADAHAASPPRVRAAVEHVPASCGRPGRSSWARRERC